MENFIQLITDFMPSSRWNLGKDNWAIIFNNVNDPNAKRLITFQIQDIFIFEQFISWQYLFKKRVLYFYHLTVEKPRTN